MTHKSTLSFCFLLAFLCSSFLLQWWHLPLYPLYILLCLTLLIGVLLQKPKLFAFILGCLIAAANIHLHTHHTTEHSVEWYAHSSKVELQGRVAAEPDRRPLDTKYTVEVTELRTASGTVLFPLSGKVLVTDVSGKAPYKYGDRVTVSGKLELPGMIEDFSYKHYLERYSIYAVMYRAQVYRTKVGSTLHPLALLFALKEKVEDRINQLLPEPHASFMAGLLTGTRKGIPKDLTETFAITGLTHIIAISGYNISIIIAIIGNMLFWLPIQKRFIPSVIAIIAFTLFVGASAAVVRAAIMGILGLIAMRTERLTHARLSVLWTAFFMLIWNPLYLWYDAGFQLSFAAVLGLMEIGPHLERYCIWLPKRYAIRESMQMTLSAQIATLPLSLMLFGRFSLIAPLANILAAPAIPLAMLIGTLGVFLSLLSKTLGLVSMYIAWLLLEWIIQMATLLSTLHYASVSITLPGVWMFALYLALAMLITWKSITNGKGTTSVHLQATAQ